MKNIFIKYNKKTDSFNVSVIGKFYCNSSFDFHKFLEDQIIKYFKRHKILNKIFNIYHAKRLIKKFENDLYNNINNRLDIMIKTKQIFINLEQFNSHYEKISLPDIVLR